MKYLAVACNGSKTKKKREKVLDKAVWEVSKKEQKGEREGEREREWLKTHTHTHKHLSLIHI